MPATSDSKVVANDGFHDLVDVYIPEGTLLHPIRPAALSCRTHFLGRLMDVLSGLLGQRAPEFMTAAGFSDSPHFMYSGESPCLTTNVENVVLRHIDEQAIERMVNGFSSTG